MKKFKIKALLIVLIMVVCAAMPLCLAACQRKHSNNLTFNVSHKIYKWVKQENGTKVRGDLLEDTSIKIGQDYSVVFDIKCDDLKATLQDEEIFVRLIVQFGGYASDDSNKLLESWAILNGIEFVETSNGVWQALFRLSKDIGMPNFSTCNFLINMPTMGLNSEYSYQNMSLEFLVEGKETTREILLGDIGTNKYVVTFTPQKGDLLFTKEDNMRKSDQGLNSVEITIPKNSVYITVELCFDEDRKNGSYGDKEIYTEDRYLGFGTDLYLIINIKSLLIARIGEDRYNALLDGSRPSVYVIITAEGGNNYNPSVIQFNFDLEG